jgi:SAM-dependent methyltransferase
MTKTRNTTDTTDSAAQLRDHIRDHYATAARAVTTKASINLDTSLDSGCCGTADTCCATPVSLEEAPFGAGRYTEAERDQLPADAVAASLGCGNPLAVADLHEGETVLDLGSGGGIDVLLSARRVGPTGTAYGLDMTDEMLDLARRNAAAAGATNVEFLKGDMEAIPLPEASVDVVISNCVINLSTDKPAVFAETFRVLRPGGRFGVSDVVAEDHLTPADRAARGNHVGCIAGCLTITEYRDHLAAAGFTNVAVTPTHEVTDAIHAAIVRATRPATHQAG